MIRKVPMRAVVLVWIAVGIMVLSAGCGKGSLQHTVEDQVEIIVSAAASLKDALEDVRRTFVRSNGDVKLTFNFGSSGALQQQIEQGAPADLYLPAAGKHMIELVDKQLIVPGKHKTLLAGELVAVVAKDGTIQVAKETDLTKPEVKSIAIGIPESVPAGSYAKESLLAAKLWEALQGKIVQGKDVRQVLQYVETGNTDVGFVYRTDALSSDKVKVAFAAAPGSYSAIRYPVGIVKATEHPQEAERVYRYLQSKEALDIFVKHGFTAPE